MLTLLIFFKNNILLSEIPEINDTVKNICFLVIFVLFYFIITPALIS